MRGNAEYHHECDVNLQRAVTFIQHFCKRKPVDSYKNDDSHNLFGSNTGSLGNAQSSTILVLRKLALVETVCNEAPWWSSCGGNR